MSTETISSPASSEDNRLAARAWIDAFNARDDDRETGARTAGYIAHAPESMQLPPLDSDALGRDVGRVDHGPGRYLHSLRRDVAQPGRAPPLGGGGRAFESRRPA